MKNVIKKIVAVAMACTLAGSYSGVINTPFSNTESIMTVDAASVPYNAKVNCGAADFYNSPRRTHAGYLYTKPRDTVVAVLEVKGDWAKVSTAGGGQWVELKYIEEIKEVEAIRLTHCKHDCERFKIYDYSYDVEFKDENKSYKYNFKVFHCDACGKKMTYSQYGVRVE